MTKPRVSISNITDPALAISAAYVAASAVDPIFPVLKEYLRCHGEWHRLREAGKAAQVIAQLGRGIVPASDRDDLDHARDAMEVAAGRITDTTPSTIAGIAELMRFVMDDPTEVFDFGEQEWPRELFVAVLAGLDNITAAGSRAT